jgi:hypothetical protein
MPGFGWSYLVVTLSEDAAAVAPAAEGAPPGDPDPAGAALRPKAISRWTASDASTFNDELEMFRELGVTGWELVAIREARDKVHYYFKRPRS